MLAFPALTPSQEQIATWLGRGYSMSDAARLGKVDRSTIYYWIEHRPEFRKAIQTAQQKCHANLRSALEQEDQVAVSILQDLLHDAGTPEHLRVEVAKAVLSLTRQAPVEWDGIRVFRAGVKYLEENHIHLAA